MSLEKEKEKDEKDEKVTPEVTGTKPDAEAIGIAMAKPFAEEMKSINKAMAKSFAEEMKSIKKESKDVPDKVIKAHRIEVVGRTQKCGSFKNADDFEIFAKEFVCKTFLEKVKNKAALSTYQNISTDADGGSFDPVTANGILADSVEKYPSHITSTLQVPVMNSSATFIDHTSDATTYVIGEATAGTQSKPGNTTRTVTLKKLLTLCNVTGEVFRFGSLVNIASETLDSMARATSLKQQHLIFAADGTADTNDGSITGVIEAISNVSDNATIYEVAGNGWDKINNVHISNIVARVNGYADPSKFAWYCHQNQWGFLEGLARTLGGATYVSQVGQRPILSLFGYEVKFTNLMPSSYRDNEIGLLFGDLSAMVATATDGQIYTDIDGSQYFDTDVVTLRMIQHMGVNVFQPGTSSKTGSVIAVKYLPGS